MQYTNFDNDLLTRECVDNFLQVIFFSTLPKIMYYKLLYVK